jgi:hypothetical protein
MTTTKFVKVNRPPIRHLIGRVMMMKVGPCILDDDNKLTLIQDVLESVGGPFTNGRGRKVRATIEAMENWGEMEKVVVK